MPEPTEPLTLEMNFLIHSNTRNICAGLTCPFRVADQSQSMESQESRHLHHGVVDQPFLTFQA